MTPQSLWKLPVPWTPRRAHHTLENYRPVFHKLPQAGESVHQKRGHFYRGKHGDISNEG